MLAQEIHTLSPSDPEWVKKFPQPKFQIGQQVEYTWTCHDKQDRARFGRTFTNYGFVTGCSFVKKDGGNNGLVFGWSYQVFYDYMADQAFVDNIIPVNHYWRIADIDQDELDPIDLNPD